MGSVVFVSVFVFAREQRRWVWTTLWLPGTGACDLLGPRAGLCVAMNSFRRNTERACVTTIVCSSHVGRLRVRTELAALAPTNSRARWPSQQSGLAIVLLLVITDDQINLRGPA